MEAADNALRLPSQQLQEPPSLANMAQRNVLGNHGRKSAADMLPSWRRKRWSPKRKRSQG